MSVHQLLPWKITTEALRRRVKPGQISVSQCFCGFQNGNLFLDAYLAASLPNLIKTAHSLHNICRFAAYNGTMSENEKRPPANPRRYHQANDRKFLIMVILTLVVVGGGSIALIFGPVALLTALPFLLGGALLILLPWGLLTAVQKWRDHMEQEERDALDRDT